MFRELANKRTAITLRCLVDYCGNSRLGEGSPSAEGKLFPTQQLLQEIGLLAEASGEHKTRIPFLVAEHDPGAVIPTGLDQNLHRSLQQAITVVLVGYELIHLSQRTKHKV